MTASERTRELEDRLADLDRRLGEPATLAEPRRLQELGRERRRLEPLVAKAREVDRLRADVAADRDLLAGPDPDAQYLGSG